MAAHPSVLAWRIPWTDKAEATWHSTVPVTSKAKMVKTQN